MMQLSRTYFLCYNLKMQDKELKEIVFKHFLPYKYKVYLFGSRASGTNQPFSDYDIGILGKRKIPLSALSEIAEELDNSDIPYKVDIVDLKPASAEFRKAALENAILWNK